MPPQQGQPIPQAHQRALIPSSTIDFPVQRRWAASIFVALQAWKATDLVLVYQATYPEQYNGILLKWWLIDALYFFALYVAKIPWLQFSALKTLILATMLLWLDLAAFSAPTIGFTGLFFKTFLTDVFGQQISVSQARMVNIKNIVQNSSHILGKHAVHILPYGTAKLNANNDFYCLSPTHPDYQHVYIPIILNNTVPRSISLSRYEFDTEATTTKEYKGREIQRATEISDAKEGVQYYYIKLTQPGAYKLERIISVDDLEVRLYDRVLFIFSCPTAQFKPLIDTDYCVEDQGTLQVDVEGVPPFNIEYNRVAEAGKTTNLKLERIQPLNHVSPLQKLPNGLTSADVSFFSSKKHEDYKWGAVQKISIPLNLTFNTISQQTYKLSRVIDGAGNAMDLTSTQHQAFSVHPRPTIKFGCSQTNPVNLLIGSDHVDIPVKIEGTAPFWFNYTGTQIDGSLEANLDDHEQKTVPAYTPGEYQLDQFKDRYCQGHVILPSACQVVQPAFPSIQVTTNPIPSECNGDNEIGMRFLTELTGTPPYSLEYTVFKIQGKTKKRIERKVERVDRSRHIFSYLPDSSGEYIYEIDALSDKFYKNRPTAIEPIHQAVHPQPDAKFSGGRRANSIQTCLGNNVNIDVELSGDGPFELLWTVDKQKYKHTVEGNKYTIMLPPIENPGNFVVSLVQIKDSNMCIKDLEARDFHVNIRRDRPTASFYTNDGSQKTVEITEGSGVDLPLRLTGDGPWIVTYRNVEQGDRSKRVVTFKDPNAQIKVNHIGHYELIDVQDATCKGTITGPRYEVKWIDRPAISIAPKEVSPLTESSFERLAVCQGEHDSVEVLFAGRGPFYCSYEEYHRLPNKKRFERVGTQEITTGVHRAHLPLRTMEGGQYRYVFKSLADQRYSEPFKIPTLEVQQTVHVNPTVKFTHNTLRHTHEMCVGDHVTYENEGDKQALEIELTGAAPYEVEFSIKHQSELNPQMFTLSDIKTKKHKIQLPKKLEVSGRYTLQLLRVRDANGCSTAAVNSDGSRISLNALDIPSIVPFDLKGDVCVGDNIEFTLGGIAPFSMLYEFNKQLESVKSSTSKLTMIADKPGNLSVVSVGHQRNKCRLFTNGFTYTIREVPSTRISGGKEILENIHEGDMVQAVVDLIGTPPFEFEWRRSELIWDATNKRHYKGKVLESHMVYNVQEHQYFINTSVEGVIEIASIKDYYCQYPRKH
ncbi:hypothetical protein BY458DRAFT_556205 [Sporodiniella umbellata]|nr:hypothetical protein BY458DRAFT_556205 [Sporodiniella umbellata]